MNFNTAAYHTPISHNTLWHSDFLGSYRRNCPPRCTITFQIVPPLSCISGKTALPASVIRPKRSILRQRSLFNSDHKLFFLRGANLCAVIPLSIFFVVLSIQPKPIASSTASMYQKVPLSTGRPRFTITQHSSSLL